MAGLSQGAHDAAAIMTPRQACAYEFGTRWFSAGAQPDTEQKCDEERLQRRLCL